jgi:hypothetical protein
METITVPRRYWLFSGPDLEPRGGMTDKAPGSFHSPEEAIQSLEHGDNFAQVAAVNPSTGELETVAWCSGGAWVTRHG